MKRTTVFLLLVALFSLCACGKAEDDLATKETPVTAAPATETPAVPETAEPQEEPGILYAGTVSPFGSGYCVLTMKDALQLTAEGFSGELNWQSSDETVAVVENGLILPAGPGMADITVNDGQTAGAAVVVVDTSPTEVNAAGLLLIETGGELYECGLPVSMWAAAELEPQYCKADFPVVYEAEGVYYVQTDYLINILCCVLGEQTVLEAPDGSLPQLSGYADIRDAQPQAETRYFGDDGKNAVLTSSLLYLMPDGVLRGDRVLSRIMKDGEFAELIPYHAYVENNDLWQDAEYWLSVFGAECALRYDTERQALIVTVEKEG